MLWTKVGKSFNHLLRHVHRSLSTLLLFCENKRIVCPMLCEAEKYHSGIFAGYTLLPGSNSPESTSCSLLNTLLRVHQQRAQPPDHVLFEENWYGPMVKHQVGQAGTGTLSLLRCWARELYVNVRIGLENGSSTMAKIGERQYKSTQPWGTSPNRDLNCWGTLILKPGAPFSSLQTNISVQKAL